MMFVIVDVGCLLIYRCYPLAFLFFFFQAEDGIRSLVRSRGLGDVYKRQFLRFIFCLIKNVLLKS